MIFKKKKNQPMLYLIFKNIRIFTGLFFDLQKTKIKDFFISAKNIDI